MENLFDNRLFPIIIPGIIVIQAVFITFGGEVLRTSGLSISEWIIIVLMALIIVPIDLLRKAARNQWFGNPVRQETRSG